MRTLRLIPVAMLDIWRNVLVGRPKGPLAGLIILATYCVISAFIGGARIDNQYGQYFPGNFAFWFCGLFTFFAWTFAFPAAIYLIDIRKRN